MEEKKITLEKLFLDDKDDEVQESNEENDNDQGEGAVIPNKGF